MNFTKNMGQTDRIVRAVLGLALVVWGLMASNWLGLIGVVLLGTAAVSFCPAYLPFGFSTDKKPGAQA